MDNESCGGIAVVLAILILLLYAVKRNFDENALYIQQGYHQVSSTSAVWVK